jgi:lipopolysaccharide/colanic/teichoic acid biosynthesis glycosyltransferase
MNSDKKIIRPFKRFIDIVFSFTILVSFSPFILTSLLLLKIEQILRGRFSDPFFYSETRMSHGKPFTLYKFNIFKYEQILEARANGAFIHTKRLEHNGGVTKSGWILKQIYMDELPQFYNVLRGDLSIIGPRPVNLEVYQTLLERGVTDKNRAPGGITGSYQSHKTAVGASAIDLDKQYADHYQSAPWYKLFLLDVGIVIRTIKVIVLAKGV